MKSDNYIQSIPIKNCWMCGTGVIITRTSDTTVIQCMDCLTRGLIIKCENINEIECIKQWNNSRILLSDDDIMNITSSISKDSNIDITLIDKMNRINTYNTHYLLNDNNAKRFGYGAIIDKSGHLEKCIRPHIELVLKYFNIDYDTLNPQNIDSIYERILSSTVFTDNFLKIILYISILICEIPKKYSQEQIYKLIEYLMDLSQCYTTINRIEINFQNSSMVFSDFSLATNYLLSFLHD